MEFPVIDLEPYLSFKEAWRGEEEGGGDDGEGPAMDAGLADLCRRLASCLRETGALVVKDPRCIARDNDQFLDMMERFFEQPDEFKRRQGRPHLHYQVGVTPEGVELPRILVDKRMREDASKLEHPPHMPAGPDHKWRYMWRVGPRPLCTKFKELNAEPVVPDGFPEWVNIMDKWGCKMMEAVEVVSEMAAIGFGLQRRAFTSLMFQGPHILAPTGSDLNKYGQTGTIMAGYHYDLNFLTIHGRSRFPGLFIWLRNGQKVEVSIPTGCLLIQAGKQLEWLTGGVCAAGMHEVVVCDRTLTCINAAKKEGRSLWRVSSTLFGHIASDAILKPLGHFENSSEAHKYPETFAGDFVELELSAIKLKGKEEKGAAMNGIHA